MFVMNAKSLCVSLYYNIFSHYCPGNPYPYSDDLDHLIKKKNVMLGEKREAKIERDEQ